MKLRYFLGAMASLAIFASCQRYDLQVPGRDANVKLDEVRYTTISPRVSGSTTQDTMITGYKVQYNADGLPVALLTIDSGKVKPGISGFARVRYNSNRMPDSIYFNNGEGDIYTMLLTYTGDLVSSTENTYRGRRGNIDYRGVYTYDGGGNLTVAELRRTNNELLDSVVFTSYSGNRPGQQRVFKRRNNGRTYLDNVRSFSYDRFGNLVNDNTSNTLSPNNNVVSTFQSNLSTYDEYRLDPAYLTRAFIYPNARMDNTWFVNPNMNTKDVDYSLAVQRQYSINKACVSRDSTQHYKYYQFAGIFDAYDNNYPTNGRITLINQCSNPARFDTRVSVKYTR